jgi:hypothetical protein
MSWNARIPCTQNQAAIPAVARIMAEISGHFIAIKEPWEYR